MRSPTVAAPRPATGPRGSRASAVCHVGGTRLRSWRRLALGAVLVAAGGLGCSDLDNGPAICARPATAEPRLYDGGSVQDGWYMSADWTGELLSFPGGAYYQIVHHLGQMPRSLQFYLSFDRDGVASGGSVSEASGNEVEVKAVTEQSVTVLNGTCADFWLLAVIGVADDAPAPP